MDIQKEGFLVKKGHVRHNWRTRWFILMKKELLYFRTKGDRIPAGVVPLNGATLVCPPLESSKKPWLLNLTTHDNKLYNIQAPDQPTREEWRLAIEDCIRKLDPAKASRHEMSPTRTLTRAEGFASTNESFRDIVQAMQDLHAGVKLREFKLKNNTTKYFFTGSDAIDWLLSWSFAADRPGAVQLASEILQYGFFNPVHIDEKENVFEKMRDSLLAREMVDTQDAYYDYVVFAPAESMDLFSTYREEETESGSDSDSDEDVLAARVLGVRTNHSNSTVSEEGGGKVLKQGFLLKKGKRRHTWKARKFVLKEKEQSLLYYKGSKGHRVLGCIPLKDLTVIEKDISKQGQEGTCSIQTTQTFPSCFVSPTNSLPHPQHYSPRPEEQMKNRLVLLTATGTRFELEASDPNERDSWASYIRVATKLC